MVIQCKPPRPDSDLNIWPRPAPLHIFVSHTGGPNKIQNNFAVSLSDKLKEQTEKYNYDIFIDRWMRLGVQFPSEISRKLERTDVFIVIVSNEFFQRNWPMIELIKCTDSLPRMRIVPLFYYLTVEELRKQVNQDRGEWERMWESWSTPRRPVDVPKYKQSVQAL